MTKFSMKQCWIFISVLLILMHQHWNFKFSIYNYVCPFEIIFKPHCKIFIYEYNYFIFYSIISTPLAYRTIMIRPRIPQLRPVHQLQQRPPTHQLLIRPRNLSNLLQNSVNTTRAPPAILMRRSTPTILRTTLQSPR